MDNNYKDIAKTLEKYPDIEQEYRFELIERGD